MRRLNSAGMISAVALMLLTAACGGSTTSTSGDTGTDGTNSSGSTAPATPVSDDDPLKVLAGKLNFDFTQYCGDKPVVVGILDGYGGNAWAVGKRAMLTKLAESCPNVTDVLYADANADVQAYISAINSLAAQGANVIQTFDLFGQAPVGAFKQAQASGVLIGAANAVPGEGKVPTDLTSVVVPDFDAGAGLWVKFLTEATDNKGRIAYVGGPAGNLFDIPAIAAVQRAIDEQGSGIELVTKEPLVGNYDPATSQQVITGLLQTDPDITGVISSYTATGPAILRAFQAADLPLPAFTGQSSSMELVCLTQDLQPKNPTLQVQSLDGSPNLDAISLAKLLAKWSNIDAPELGPADSYTNVTYAEYINTVDDVLPKCDPSVPPGADFSTALDEETLVAAFK